MVYKYIQTFQESDKIIAILKKKVDEHTAITLCVYIYIT